ncbi:MAG: HAD-IB family phosphatase [Candidatus Woesearchaeota archaeon]|nr:HAD-IB family phosphatase [Candidatus Woesearchaeota archaeon]
MEAIIISVTCIIPAYNEEESISRVVEAAKKVKLIDEIIVVDDGSSDKTFLYAKEAGAKVISHPKNRGKGAAIMTGIKNASGDILLFVDADIYNISSRKISSIIKPIILDEADFVKTSFHRNRGRVTELVVKPLLKILLPFVNFKQPLSGQFAIKKELVKYLDIDERWGVDIQILIQMVKKGVRTKEVDIGFIAHKKQPLENLVGMSEQVIKAILSEIGLFAKNHKLIIFDFDNTIIKESSIDVISKELGFKEKLDKLRRKYARSEITDSFITASLALCFKGKTKKEVERACSKIHFAKHAEKVIDWLKKRHYKIAIVSCAFSPVVEFFAKQMGIDKIICPVLVIGKDGKFTGEVIAKTRHNSECCDSIFCKGDAARDLMKSFKVTAEECVAVADGKNDSCLFQACGLSLAYNPEIKTGDIQITNLSEVLVIVE